MHLVLSDSREQVNVLQGGILAVLHRFYSRFGKARLGVCRGVVTGMITIPGNMTHQPVTFDGNARFGMMSICSDISIGASAASLGALAP